MAPISCQEFIDLVIQWGNTHERTIKTMWPQQGGWEG